MRYFTHFWTRSPLSFTHTFLFLGALNRTLSKYDPVAPALLFCVSLSDNAPPPRLEDPSALGVNRRLNNRDYTLFGARSCRFWRCSQQKNNPVFTHILRSAAASLKGRRTLDEALILINSQDTRPDLMLTCGRPHFTGDTMAPTSAERSLTHQTVTKPSVFPSVPRAWAPSSGPRWHPRPPLPLSAPPRT